MTIEELSPALQVQAVENIIKEYPQVEIETHHYFGGGVYEREILVKPGTIITGKVHLTEHLAKLVKGTMTIYGDHESGTFTGPVTFVSKPGAKRVGYAHDDVVFSTFHSVGDEVSIEALDKMLVVDTVEQYQLIRDTPELLGEEK